MSKRWSSTACALILVGLIGAESLPAMAQEDATGEPPLLKGPEVQERRAPGTNRPMLERWEGRPDGRIAERYRRYRDMVEAIRALGTQAPEELRPSEEQQRTIREILGEFAREMRRFRRSMRDEGLNDARDGGDDIRPRRGEGADRRRRPGAIERPDERQASDRAEAEEDRRPAESPDRRAMLERVRRQAPDPATHQNRIWAVLNDQQREWVRTKLEAIEASRRDRVDAPAAPDAMMDGAPRAGVRGHDYAAEMPESLRQRLEAMSPRARAELWRRLERLLEAREGAEGAGRERRRLGVRDVDVPDPD